MSFWSFALILHQQKQHKPRYAFTSEKVSLFFIAAVLRTVMQFDYSNLENSHRYFIVSDMACYFCYVKDAFLDQWLS
jgi:hypothetical protein